MPTWRRILGRIFCTLFWHSRWMLIVARSPSGLEYVLCGRCWAHGVSHESLNAWFPHRSPGSVIADRLELTVVGKKLQRGWPAKDDAVGPMLDDGDDEDEGGDDTPRSA
jgi:hypothetical protein